MDLKNETPNKRRALVGLALVAAAMTAHPAPPPCDASNDDCDTFAAAPPAESPGRARIDGLDELRFNAMAGRFTVLVSGARLHSEPETVKVFVNNRLLDGDSVALSRSAIEVDYRFGSGLNEVLVIVPDTEGREVRADGLYWAGDSSMVVDVADAAMNPLNGARVTVRLGQAGTVKASAITQGGTARFEYLPDALLIVEATHSGYRKMRATAQRGSGPLLLVLSPDASLASSDQ